MPDTSSLPAITGYTDRLSARPNERLAVKVSSVLDGQYQADVVRIWNADANPAGIGIQTEPVAEIAPITVPARHQPVSLGSWGQVPATGLFADPVCVVSMKVQPWLLRAAPAALLSLTGERGETCWSLVATSAGFELRDSQDRAVASLALSPKRKVWYDLTLLFDMRDKRASLAVQPLKGGDRQAAEAAFEFLPPRQPSLQFAARLHQGVARDHYNGRIEDIVVRGQGCDGPVQAFWDFSLSMEGVSVIDSGPAGLHGHLVNLPTRGVRGSAWDGSEHAFHHAPRQYAAIHFHEDDIYDCEWDTDFEIRLPEDMASGVYGVRLRQGEAEDIIPFFVLPPKGRTMARVCYLAATYTYMAYGNHARKNLDAAMEERIEAWGTPRGPDSHPQFGFATYNFHPDGAGICYSSRLRPLLTMRPGFLTFAIHEGSGLRHFPADSHLVEWFRQKDLAIDVVTDEDLHREGVDLIKGYDAVVTGSHPEYHTTGTLDALRDYCDGGGSLVYLGGNGFYWRIAVSDTVPGVMEVRRAEGGIRAWATEPGEGFQVLDGQYGGLWRRNGRAPQALAAVGFSAQGLFEGSPYRRTEASKQPEHAWIFEGVDEEPIGDYGFSGGGAAGFELDRADFELGTPEDTVILARSEGHGPSFTVVPEEILSHIATVSGEPPKDLVRAEIVYSRLPSGGQIFATGSITFCGSLPQNGFDNGVSRMLENVIRRFSGRSAASPRN